MTYSLDDYNTVPERIAEAKALYPEGRFQSEVIELPAAFADKFIAVVGRFYRTADDPTPGYGLAWEPVPGLTNFTRNSELQNAETSAWGRALIAAFAADAKKGIASQEDIRNREPESARRPRSGGQRRTPRATPEPQESHEVAPSDKLAEVVTNYARDQVAGFKSWSEAERADSYKRHSKALLDGKPVSLEEVDKVLSAVREEYLGRFPEVN